MACGLVNLVKVSVISERAAQAFSCSQAGLACVITLETIWLLRLEVKGSA